MSQTTNFGIVLPEGTDTFNPLTFNNNAFTKVDQVMKANQDRGITTATHTFIDGINTILRSIATCNTLVFIASSDYVAGSTIAVDGVTMTFRYADGTAPKSGAFKTNQAVMCYINGTILTMINAGSIPDINASSVAFDNTESQLEATNVQDAVDEIIGKISNMPTIMKYANLSLDNGVKISATSSISYLIVVAGATSRSALLMGLLGSSITEIYKGASISCEQITHGLILNSNNATSSRVYIYSLNGSDFTVENV